MARGIARSSSLSRAVLLGTTALVLLSAAPVAARVGVTSATDGDPLGKPPQENERVLRIGLDVQANEIITTQANDRAHLVFLDGTSLTVGPNAQLTIDRFVYDPATKTGDLAVTAGKGVFRLVGGRISKKNPITINTPSSTIGIRGGITILNVTTTQTTSTFVFGNAMTVTSQTQTVTTTRPGSQVTTNLGTPPGAPTLVSQGALSNQISQLEGTGGGSGGGGSGQGSGGPGGAGGNADAGAQNFGQQNSGQGPQGGQPPGGGPGPISGGPPNPLGNDNPLTNSNVSGQQQQAANTTTTTTTTTTTKVIVTRGTAGRLLGHPLYTTFNNTTLAISPVPNDQNRPLAPTGQQTSESTTTTTTVTTAGTTTTTSTSTPPIQTITITVPGVNGGDITLPWQQNTLASGFNVGTMQILGQTLTNGRGFVDANGTFFAYIFDLGTEQVGLFGGTPTAVNTFPTSGIGAYSLTDLGNPMRLPFARETVGENPALLSAASVSPLLAAFSPGISATLGQAVPDTRSTALQATIAISGTGATQQSYMGVFTGIFFRDVTNNGGPVIDNGISLSGAYNASYRTDSSGQIGRMTSAISTADTGNGNAMYGEGGTSLVLTPDRVQTTFTPDLINPTGVQTVRTPQASFDQPYNNLNGQDYYSVTSAQKTSPGPIGQTRTTQTLDGGFVGGLVEQRSSGGTFSTRAIATESPTDFSLGTDASTNRAAATFTVATWDTGVSAEFKLGALTGSSSGTSAFIDDNVYGVRDRPAGTLSNTTTVGGSATGVTSRTSMVSYGAAPVDMFFAEQGVQRCTCEFLTWGWWGGDIRYDSGAAYNVGGRDRVHLATYVAGTLSNFASLPNTGTATFTGHAVGNVNNNGVQYTAAGIYNGGWNWGSQTGTVQIQNFDGHTYNGTAALVGSTVQFASGNLSNGAGRTGSLNGAFFQAPGNPVAGQAGSFQVSGSGYQAAGTFAGQKQP